MYFLDQVHGEIDVIKACLPTQEVDVDSEASEEIEMSQDVDLEEILGKLNVCSHLKHEPALWVYAKKKIILS